MTRPVTGADPGWPRPRLLCTADVLHDDDGCRRSRRPGDRDMPTDRPVPWLAEQDHSAWDPWEFDEDRSRAMRHDDLCQLCGEKRGDEVFFLVRDNEASYRHTSTEMFGGALCSLRCARLTAAVCPRYTEHWPVEVYAVAKPARTDIVGCGEDNDDELTLAGSDARLVAVVGSGS